MDNLRVALVRGDSFSHLDRTPASERQMNGQTQGYCTASRGNNSSARMSIHAHQKKCYIVKLVPCGTDGRHLLSGFQAVVTLTLTLYRVIRHTVVHQSSTSIYMPYVIEIRKTFCGRTNRRDSPSSRSRDTKKLGQISQIRPEQIQILWSSLRIGGHLPATIVNGEGDRT